MIFNTIVQNRVLNLISSLPFDEVQASQTSLATDFSWSLGIYFELSCLWSALVYYKSLVYLQSQSIQINPLQD